MPSLSSLRARLSLGLGALAIVFLGTIGVVLDRAFQASVIRGAEARLDVYLLALVGFAELDGESVRLPDAQLDLRFVQPGSGLYGIARGADRRILWRSDSTLGRPLDAFAARATAPPGRIRYDLLDGGELGPLLIGELNVAFERPGRRDAAVTFVVALDRGALDAEVGVFRNALWLGLGGVGVLLLAASFVLFRVVTRPLRRLTERVTAVEQGEAETLGVGWPDELAGVTAHLDRFIVQERGLRERYRTLTDDLAHSLKTPLAVLRNSLAEAPVGGDGAPAADHELLRAQVARMETVLANRLDRVVVRPVLARAQAAAGPVLDELVRALRRLYARHEIALDVEQGAAFPGEARDLMEIAGNLTDNACKYGVARARVSARTVVDPSGARQFELCVDNDGEPIPEALRQAVRERGIRADQREGVDGQGIGLAVVDDLVRGHGGTLLLEASELGGTRVCVRVPMLAGS
jgi:two-component system sensor histidine kinase PhoQ